MLTAAKAVGVLLTPPGIVLIIAIIGLLLLPRRRVLATVLLWTSMALLLILSLPVTGSALLRSLEKSFPALPAETGLDQRPGAIIVLGGGRYANAPEYGADTLNQPAVERLRYAARLHRLTGLPLLVTGGSVFGERVPEAELMRQVLSEDFHVEAEWVEGRSRNTYENAVFSRAILEAAGVRHILLVTHAWHMPRAAWAFRQAGLSVVSAPVGFSGTGDAHTVLDYLPSSRGLLSSSRALSEYLGSAWYRVRYRFGDVEAVENRPTDPSTRFDPAN